MQEQVDNRLVRLRERAERALASGRRGGDLLTLLETLTREAPDGSNHAVFAHRNLAEIQLEGAPWRAALHLRRVIDAGAADDGAHALMGLCQALLGNYRAAVSAYRKAVRLSPHSPWYHHNLGHLLDVGLGESLCALDHLRIARRLQPHEHEITASLAHCLARLSHIEEARRLAEEAVASAPRSREHRMLLDWILDGAPRDGAPRSRASRPARRDAADGSDLPPTEAVVRLLERQMPAAGFSEDKVRLAHSLWLDYCGGRGVRVTKPAVYAAAVEYAIAQLEQADPKTLAELSRRYGVTARAVALRYEQIRNALELAPLDPRYARK